MDENTIEILNNDVLIEISDDNSAEIEIENIVVFDYLYAADKPCINSIQLVGNKTSSDLGLASASEINLKEDILNKVTSLDNNVTDVQYPSAKCVEYNLQGKVNTDLSNLSLQGQELIDSKASIDFSNLSYLGENRLHSLKSYLDEGVLLIDEEGLADVKYYAHSSFDESKFTKEGSPTITEGVANGFTSSNYLKKEITLSSFSTIKIKGSFTTGSSFTNNQWAFQIKNNNTTQYVDVATISGVLRCRVTTISKNFNINTNTKYYYEIENNSTTWTARLSTDGQTWTEQTLGQLSVPSNFDIVLLGARSDGYPWEGSIDLKEISVTVDGIPVFSGNKTGTDTYTIGGNTVTIPYTLSKTGSKIVDSVYRTQVASVYNEFGYAPYYTLSDTDFTLPMGEVYGMMLNQSTPHIVQSYVNSFFGYIVYSNGYCEQWGKALVNNGHTGFQATLAKTYKDTNYLVIVCPQTSSYGTYGYCAKPDTSSSFIIHYDQTNPREVGWRTFGYIY